MPPPPTRRAGPALPSLPGALRARRYLHGGDDQAAVHDELAERRRPLVAAPPVHHEQPAQVLEARDGEVRRQRRCPPLLQRMGASETLCARRAAQRACAARGPARGKAETPPVGRDAGALRHRAGPDCTGSTCWRSGGIESLPRQSGHGPGHRPCDLGHRHNHPLSLLIPPLKEPPAGSGRAACDAAD